MDWSWTTRVGLAVAFLASGLCAGGHDDFKGIDAAAPPVWGPALLNGAGASAFSLSNIVFQAQMPLNTIGGGAGVLGNDLWGWTDPLTGSDYALFGRTDGTAFVDVTDPGMPVYLGSLPSHNGGNTAWRDIKVYDNHAFIVADQLGTHGLQVFDLTNLRGVTSPQIFAETAHYAGFGNAHNLAINEDTGYAYVVGSNASSGGLHIVNVQTPTAPVFAGSFGADGYTHDTQVVVYHGPDTAYAGRELAFSSNEDTLTIVDVTTKSAPVLVARRPYGGSRYSHQGWLTEDHRYFLMDDELDEYNGAGIATRTHVWDVTDLTNTTYVGFYSGARNTIDHNQYVTGGLVYQANYTSGLRVLQPLSLSDAQFREIAWFDTYPANDAVDFNGAWSVYPFFSSGTILVSDRQNGLFVLQLENFNAVPEPQLVVLLALGAMWLTGLNRPSDSKSLTPGCAVQVNRCGQDRSDGRHHGS